MNSRKENVVDFTGGLFVVGGIVYHSTVSKTLLEVLGIHFPSNGEIIIL